MTGVQTCALPISTKGARVELYIDNGNGDWNKSTFDKLFENKQKIEDVFEHTLVWDRLDDNRASLIRFPIDQFGLQDKENWPELQDLMIDAMIKFDKVFRPYTST